MHSFLQLSDLNVFSQNVSEFWNLAHKSLLVFWKIVSLFICFFFFWVTVGGQKTMDGSRELPSAAYRNHVAAGLRWGLISDSWVWLYCRALSYVLGFDERFQWLQSTSIRTSSMLGSYCIIHGMRWPAATLLHFPPVCALRWSYYVSMVFVSGSVFSLFVLSPGNTMGRSHRHLEVWR